VYNIVVYIIVVHNIVVYIIVVHNIVVYITVVYNIVVYILIFLFLGSKLENKSFCTEGSRHFLRSVCLMLPMFIG
jgi:hypothetical protein